MTLSKTATDPTKYLYRRMDDGGFVCCDIDFSFHFNGNKGFY